MMYLSGMKELNINTEEFLKQHLIIDQNEKAALNWLLMEGNSLPSQDRPGCYAFLSEEGNILYIGVGAGRGPSDLYKDCGLGSRVFSYLKTRANLPNIEFKSKRYKDCKKIATIGLHPDFWYLAYALEQYLISKIKPKLNSIASGRK